MVDLSHKGKVFQPYSYHLDHNKVREFLAAVQDDNAEFAELGSPVPPTFTTVFTFWGGVSLESMLREVDVEIWNVLHAEQTFEYFAPICVGDTITGQSTITDIYSKAGMNFVEIVTEFTNQDNLPVVKDRALIIVRG
jgi:hypothetical protein